MSPSPPFVDLDTGTLDLGPIRAEAFPLAGLIVLFGTLGVLPFALTLVLSPSSMIALVLTLLAQLVFAVGAGVILIYIVARGIQLAEE